MSHKRSRGDVLLNSNSTEHKNSEALPSGYHSIISAGGKGSSVDPNLKNDQDTKENESCEHCRKPITSYNALLVEGNFVHPECYEAATLKTFEEKAHPLPPYPPVQRNNTVNAPEQMINLKAGNRKSGIYIVTQPEKFQIANYNIHPPPALALSFPMNQNITMYAHLVESEMKTLVSGGFQSGDVRVLRAGQTTLLFNGLKLSKMGPIKSELHYQNYKRIPSTFCIQFKIGNNSIFSEPFKLVSSCAQLPPDVRDIVRPSKRSFRLSDQPAGEPIPTPSFFFEHKSPQQIVEESGVTRMELESAIESADIDAAGRAAQKLAYLKKIQLSTAQKQVDQAAAERLFQLAQASQQMHAERPSADFH